MVKINHNRDKFKLLDNFKKLKKYASDPYVTKNSDKKNTFWNVDLNMLGFSPNFNKQKLKVNKTDTTLMDPESKILFDAVSVFYKKLFRLMRIGNTKGFSETEFHEAEKTIQEISSELTKSIKKYVYGIIITKLEGNRKNLPGKQMKYFKLFNELANEEYFLNTCTRRAIEETERSLENV